MCVGQFTISVWLITRLNFLEYVSTGMCEYLYMCMSVPLYAVLYVFVTVTFSLKSVQSHGKKLFHLTSCMLSNQEMSQTVRYNTWV